MIEDNRVYEILAEICENVSPKRSKRGFVARCPVCGDSQKSKRIRRLHVDWYSKHGDFACTCYNGGCPFRSGNVYSLYATVKGVTFKEAKKYIDEDTYDSEKIVQSLSASKAPEIEEPQKPQQLDLFERDILFKDDVYEDLSKVEKRYHDALTKFIKDRYIPEDYTVYIAIDGRYKSRYIIPIFINNKLEYFQGRAMFDEMEPKYLNPEVDKDMIISNIDKFKRDKYIIVTEGLIDSWMIENHQGTSVNGGYFNDEILEVLLKMTDAGVILAPDNPLVDKAGKEELEKYMEEGKYSGRVKYFLKYPENCKDLNDLRKKQPDMDMYGYVTDNAVGKFAAEMELNLREW